MDNTFVGATSPQSLTTRKAPDASPGKRELVQDVSSDSDGSDTPWVHIVLPAYNEQSALEPVIRSIALSMNEYSIPYSIIVVDDGSEDKTSEIASELGNVFPVDLIRHSRNQGLAQAMRTGLRAAVKSSNANDIVVTMDADNTHPAGLIDRMRRMIGEGHDIVIASRYQPGSRVLGVPFFRRMTAMGARFLFTVVLPIRGVRDYTCGFRAYRASLLADAFSKYRDQLIEEKGFGCMAEILLKIGKMNPVAGEVPMILRYDRKQGDSKMAVGKTIWQTLRMALRIRFSKE